ncbi:MAG TPA: polyprenyl synthetase family protein [Nocardioidaceae bacterium]|nr:polyprenyl synthetase family protein [Nocardioidaceae bacterium]
MPTSAADPSWDDSAFRGAVQAVLDGFVAEQGRGLAPLGPDVAELVAAAREAVSGGKRLRAAFCYWGYRCVTDASPGSPAHHAVVRAAAALELLHASALVHDDLMDGSDTRRGHPAAHRRFEQLHGTMGMRGDPGQYGAAGAILLGDLLLSWADELLRTCGLDAEPVRAALGCFDTTRSEVIAGQFLDVTAQTRGSCDVATAMRVLRYKSAKYSVERPLHIGATLAGGDDGVRAALSDFGLPLGEAFQLRDDLLGVFGDPQVTGKPSGDDLREGKRTVLVALALESAAPDHAAVLDRSLGASLTGEQVAALQQLIRTSGAPDRVERLIDELTTRALDGLAVAPVTEPARAALRALAQAATQRDL